MNQKINPAVKGIVELNRGTNERKSAPGTGIARLVLNYWADKGAEVINAVQHRLTTEKTAELIGIAATRSPITRKPVQGEYVRLLDSAIIVDMTHPSYWQKPENEVFDQASVGPDSNDLSIGDGGPPEFHGVENPTVNDFFQPTPYERALAQQTSRQQS